MRDSGVFPFVCVLVCALAACIASPIVTPSVRPIRYPTEQATSRSGMRVVFEVAPDFGIGGAVLGISAGSADEPPDKGGLAHLVEHLTMQGRKGDLSVMHRLEGLGAGAYNAMTTWDATTYYAFGPPQNLPAILSILAESLDDPLASIDQATFEHERQIVLDEMRSRAENGTPGQTVGLLAAEVFPSAHPYARVVIGSEESVARLTLSDARAFARKYYRPAASVLAISSPSSPEVMREWVATVEGSHAWPTAQPIQREGSPERHADLSPSPAHGVAIRELPVATRTLWIGWSIPPPTTPQGDAAALVSAMVGGTFWVHLYDRDRDIASVHASIVSGTDASLFVVQATLNEGNDPQASADSLVRTLLRGLGEQTYIASTFDAYRRYASANLIAAEEPIVSRTLNMAESMRLTGEPTYLRSRAERTVALDSGTVADFYHAYLAGERAHVMFVRPPSGRTGSRGKATLGPDVGLGNAEKTPPPSASDIRSWMRPPGIAASRHVTLDNGLEVVVLPRPGSPFHSLVVAYHGGRGDERVPGAGVASLWAKERYKVSAGAWGVEYADQVGVDFTREILRATGSDLGLTLRELAAERAYRVFWPPPQFSARIQSFESEDRSADAMFHRSTQAAFYGGHPYGRVTTSAELRVVRPNDVYGFLDAIRRPDNGLAVVVGDVDPSAAVALVSSSQLGTYAPSAGRALAAVPPMERAASRPGGRIVVQDRRGSSDVRMRFLCALPPARDGSLGVESVFAYGVQANLWGELRERIASSYGVQVNVDAMRGGTTVFELSGDIDPDHLSFALEALRRFVEQPMTTFFDEPGMARSRGAAARALNLELGTTERLALRVVSEWNLGRPIEDVDRYPEMVEAASRDDVVALGKHCQDNWTLGLMGDASRIWDGLEGWRP